MRSYGAEKANQTDLELTPVHETKPLSHHGASNLIGTLLLDSRNPVQFCDETRHIPSQG